MEKKKAKSKSKLPTLPDHLIVEEILPRLPVKSLLRFKSVSKYWHTTICSNEFQQQQLKFSSLCPQMIIFDHGYYIYPSYLLSFDECNNVKECVKLEDKYPVYNPPSRDKHGNPHCHSFVVGSCNGLVCLFDDFDEGLCFILWNPATNQNQKVDFPDCDYQHVVDCSSMGFGYVSSIDDYRIGLLIYFCHDFDDIIKDKVEAYIYSLRARKWITVAIVDDELSCDNHESVVVDDFLYWSPDPGCQSYLLGLNLVTGLPKKIPLMNLFSDYDENVHISQIKGCLSLGCVKNSNVGSSSRVYDVWLLKKPDDCNSWVKTLSLNIGVGDQSYDLLHSHLFEMGKCLISRNKRVMLIDLCEGAQEQYELIDLCEGAQEQYDEQGNNTSHHQGSTTKGWELPMICEESCGYVESLISPFITYEHEDDSTQRVEEDGSTLNHMAHQNAG